MAVVKLVFVDDDVDDRDLIKEGCLSLQIDNYTVLDSGATLMALLDNLKDTELPEAILLDLNMPSMSGMEVLHTLKSLDRYQAISVYILTTASTTFMRQRCLDAGAADYFVKPNTLADLYALLNMINSTIME